MTADAVFRIVRIIGHKDVCIWKLDIVDRYVPAVEQFLRYVAISNGPLTIFSIEIPFVSLLFSFSRIT